MSELGPEARAALALLREQVGSASERDRVSRRLATLGIAVSSASALGAMTTAHAALSSAPAGAAATVSAATSLGAAGASAAGGTIGAASAASTSAAVTSSAGAGAASVSTAFSATSGLSAAAASAVGASVGFGAKLAALPFALKISVASAVLASGLAMPLTMQRLDAPSSKAAPVAPAAAATAPTATSGYAAASESEAATSPAKDVVEADEPSPPPALGTRAATAVERHGPSVRRSVPPEVPLSSALARESTLLESALRALRAGDLERAEELLERHAREHGAGALLARERDRMRTELTQRVR